MDEKLVDLVDNLGLKGLVELRKYVNSSIVFVENELDGEFGGRETH